MSAVVTVTVTLEPVGPATNIPLTDEQVQALGGARSAPVVVTVGERSARLRLARTGGSNVIGLSKASRAELGVEIGQTVEATIVHDTAPREVTLPAALVEALDAEGLRSTFDALAPSRRKEHARSVTEARSEETRARRVAKVVDALRR